MARIRTIKPEFFTSEDIVELCPWTRLLYIATWCEADKEGRLAWKPKTFKMRYFPNDSVDVDAMCQLLVERGLVVLYGNGLAFIPTFAQHQHVNPRETASKLPHPNDASSTRAARVSDGESTRREEGKEGKDIDDASRPDDIHTSGDAASTDEPDDAKYDPRKDLLACGVPNDAISDWFAVRKTKRAANTKSAMDAMKREAAKVGLSIPDAVKLCAERSWQSVQAHYLADKPIDKPTKKDYL